MLPKCIGRTPAGRTPIEAKVYASWRERNWGGNIFWAPGGSSEAVAALAEPIVEPASLSELCEVVRAASSVRVLGRGHSFVPICVADGGGEAHIGGGTMVSLNKLSKVLSLDEEKMTVTVEGGITYSQLVGYLSAADRPFALANVQSHPGFTVAGTLATGSHGSSGIDPATGRAWLGSQASLCRAVLFVLADGTTRRFEKGVDAEWPAAVVNLGCLGVMAEITLDLVADHDYALTVYRNLVRLCHRLSLWFRCSATACRCGGRSGPALAYLFSAWFETGLARSGGGCSGSSGSGRQQRQQRRRQRSAAAAAAAARSSRWQAAPVLHFRSRLSLCGPTVFAASPQRRTCCCSCLPSDPARDDRPLAAGRRALLPDADARHLVAGAGRRAAIVCGRAAAEGAGALTAAGHGRGRADLLRRRCGPILQLGHLPP